MLQHQVTNSRGNYNYNAFIYTDTVWDNHFHSNFELVYGMAGETMVTCSGISHILQKGELLLISPYVVHSLKIKSGAKAWVGVFSESFVPNFSATYSLCIFSKFKCENRMEDFLTEFLFFAGEPERFLLQSCLYMVCSACVNNATLQRENHDVSFVEKVVSYISEHLQEEITMVEVAEALNYEYHYFSSRFNQFFSIHFKLFINMLRFEQACKLLDNHSVSITEICSLCGFGSVRNFNRVFKSLGGITPMEYRKSRQVFPQ